MAGNDTNSAKPQAFTPPSPHVSPKEIISSARSEFHRIAAAMVTCSSAVGSDNVIDVPADFIDEANMICEAAKKAVVDYVLSKKATMAQVATSREATCRRRLATWLTASWIRMRLAVLKARSDSWERKLDDGLAGVEHQRSSLMYPGYKGF